MSDLRRVRAVAFDLDNTLVDRDAAACAVLRERLDETACRRAMALDRSGYGGDALATFLQRHVDELASRSPDEIGLWFRSALVTRLPPVPDEIAAHVRHRRVPFALVTNGGPTQREKLTRSGLELDHVLVSAELGFEKPSLRVYRLAADVLRCAPEELLFVGDHPENDVDGPSRAGYATLWVARGRTFPPGLRRPTVTVDSIDAAFAVLHRHDLC